MNPGTVVPDGSHNIDVLSMYCAQVIPLSSIKEKNNNKSK
jgi:hypothetical protein